MAFTQILIPTDFSEPANRALHYALEEATFHHANVTLLHVLPAHTGTDVYFIAGGPGVRTDFEPALERRLGTSTPPKPTVVLQDHHEAALTQLRDLMPASFQGTWDVDVAAGPPAETIVHKTACACSCIRYVSQNVGRPHNGRASPRGPDLRPGMRLWRAVSAGWIGDIR
jgi:nucleotide-binding universal stress UspA family protein